jgi:hypothetical protein
MVGFKAIPRVVTGTQPKVCWITLDTQDLENFNYSIMPQLQTSKVLNVKSNSTTYFRLSGRQDDFNYWYSPDKQEGPTSSIRLHSLAPPSEKEYWTFQLKFFVSFRQLKIPVANKLNGDENICLNEKNNIKKLDENESNISVKKINKSNLGIGLITKEVKSQEHDDISNIIMQRNKSEKNLDLEDQNLKYISFHVEEIFAQEKINFKIMKSKYTLEELNEVKKNNKFKLCDTRTLIFDWLATINFEGIRMLDYSIETRIKITDIFMNKIPKKDLDEFVQNYILTDQLIVKYGVRDEEDEDDLE